MLLAEPTNDVDTDMLAAMEDLLDSWPGTLIVVSHDRYLLERVTDQQCGIFNGHLRHLPGGVEEYLQRAQQTEHEGAGPAELASAVGGLGDAAAQAGLTGAERHAVQKELSSLERRLDRHGKQISGLHAKMADHDPTDFEGLQDLTDQAQLLEREVEELEEQWLELSERLGWPGEGASVRPDFGYDVLPGERRAMVELAAMAQYRGELIGYCYRFFGCYFEAEDAVQETFTRAWQHEGEFQHRSSLRRWLYAIATNACLDMKKARQRRSLPMDLTSPGEVPAEPGALKVLPEASLIGPISDAHLSEDPAELAVISDSVRLAFIAALQVLPPRQRVVLILRDVLAWPARECADLLETTTASVNSALIRARETMRTYEPRRGGSYDEQLLMNYVAAFEAYDVDRLVVLLAEDAQFTMPPFELWFQGREQIEKWWRGPGEVCRGSRALPTRANGQPATAVYHPDGPGHWTPFAIHVLDLAAGRIAGITHFMGPEVFAEFGLPDHLSEDEPVEESQRER